VVPLAGRKTKIYNFLHSDMNNPEKAFKTCMSLSMKIREIDARHSNMIK
jgi:hypothetical protein